MKCLNTSSDESPLFLSALLSLLLDDFKFICFVEGSDVASFSINLFDVEGIKGCWLCFENGDMFKLMKG